MSPKETLINAIDTIYERWKLADKQFFGGERWRDYYSATGNKRDDYLDSCFIDELKNYFSQDSGWNIIAEVKISGLPPIWSKYDVGCYYQNTLVGLIELSVGDSNVAHALHNGEVKLLGICSGVSFNNMNNSFSAESKLGEDVSYVNAILSRIPVRALFYTKGDGLYKKKKTQWFITKPKGYAGETRFHSALFPVGSFADLNTVFNKLNEKGLYTWYL